VSDKKASYMPLGLFVLSAAIKKRARTTCRVVFALAAGGALLGHVQAQNQIAIFPSKPVRIVVPYPPGGFNDTLGRVVANHLSKIWEQPVLVENKPGGGTIIGTQVAAAAAPDGYTLLVVQFPFAANPWMYKSLPYDTEKAFSPVVLAGHSPMVLVTHSGSSIGNFSDFLARAKAKPGALNYGSSGPGSSNHLAMAFFESQAGVKITQVPYKGSTPLLTDLAGGQLDVAFDALPHVLPFVQSGKMRTIALASAKRSPTMPDLPTIGESGLPNFEVSSWHGFVVPAGTPNTVIERLNRDINAVLANNDVKKIFAQQGVVPDGGTPAQFKNFMDGQMALWKKVILQAKITAD
jgi:tripartite-type tricarboxylate transporter receptor subunit TctC